MTYTYRIAIVKTVGEIYDFYRCYVNEIVFEFWGKGDDEGMQKYMNSNGTSGVEGYEIGPDYIKVKFKTTAQIYTYSYESAGRNHIEQMKILARQGSGLNSYINTCVKYKYVR